MSTMSKNNEQDRGVEIMSGSSMLVIEPTQFKGTDYVDVRKYYNAGDEFKPTPKGIMIPLDNAEAVAEAILKVVKSGFKRTGLLDSESAADRAPTYVVVPYKDLKRVPDLLRVPDTFVFESVAEARKVNPDKIERGTDRLHLCRLTFERVTVSESMYKFRAPELTRIAKWAEDRRKWIKAS